MKDQYKELREDVLDEEKAVEETLGRLHKVRSQFDPQSKDYSTEPAMGTYLMNFYNGIENILKRIAKTIILLCLREAVGIKNFWCYPSIPLKGRLLYLTRV